MQLYQDLNLISSARSIAVANVVIPLSDRDGLFKSYSMTSGCATGVESACDEVPVNRSRNCSTREGCFNVFSRIFLSRSIINGGACLPDNDKRFEKITKEVFGLGFGSSDWK
jgi:hypothetical protein